MKWQFAVLLALAAPVAHAAPWLCTDRDGVKTYSYEQESATRKNCVHKPIPSPNVWRTAPRGSATESKDPDFPTVDARTQKHRDADRRRILERELAEEKKALADAMKRLEEATKQVEEQRRARSTDRNQARIE